MKADDVLNMLFKSGWSFLKLKDGRIRTCTVGEETHPIVALAFLSEQPNLTYTTFLTYLGLNSKEIRMILCVLNYPIALRHLVPVDRNELSRWESLRTLADSLVKGY